MSESSALHVTDFAFQNTLLDLVITCSSNLEPLLFDEINEIIAASQQVDGATKNTFSVQLGQSCVYLKADLSTAYCCCVWSRLAEQVLLRVGEWQITEEAQDQARQQLYQMVYELPWEKVISFEQSFKIEANGKQQVFHDPRFAALVCKDAIADRFRKNYDKRPNVNRDDADLHLHLFMQENSFSLNINLSGERLHKRSYRQKTVEAPMKETLAAALLRQLGWHKHFSGRQYFVDPCCGSGTLPIEALMMAADIAPGLSRKQYGFEKLNFHNEVLWQMVLQEAAQRRQDGLQNFKDSGLKIRAYDSDSQAIHACKFNVAVLGLESFIHVERRSFAQLSGKKLLSESLMQDAVTTGLLICNPPYGERLQEVDELKYLYQFLGECFEKEFPLWQVGVICNQVELLDALRFRKYEQQRFYNGNLACLFRYTEIPATTAPDQYQNWFLSCLQNKTSAQSDDNDSINNVSIDLQNRLVKNLSKLKPWLVQENIYCFRLYDADLPEFNAAIDCYQHKQQVWMMVSEYAAPKTIKEDVAKERFSLLLKTVRHLFSLQREQVYIKLRKRQKGSSQYTAQHEQRAKSSKLLTVSENGLSFLINPTDYLDTGLFLDHRRVRQMIRQQVKGKRFLNLFCYTGSASVYAAAGGASSTVSVDLSENYLVWARKNLLLNGFALNMQRGGHKTEKADVMRWLSESKEQFDLIFLDPPTFSNTKKKGLLFDVQLHHRELIELCMKRLDDTGQLIFSSNYRSFEIDASLSKQFQVEEISRETLSPDFSRQRVPHRCWLISKNLRTSE